MSSQCAPPLGRYDILLSLEIVACSYKQCFPEHPHWKVFNPPRYPRTTCGFVARCTSHRRSHDGTDAQAGRLQHAHGGEMVSIMHESYILPSLIASRFLLMSPRHLGFKSWAYTPTERGFDSHFGYFAGSQDYWNKESLCWAGQFTNGCFENTTATGEPVTGIDFHRNREPVRNNTDYSTCAYTSGIFLTK